MSNRIKLVHKWREHYYYGSNYFVRLDYQTYGMRVEVYPTNLPLKGKTKWRYRINMLDGQHIGQEVETLEEAKKAADDILKADGWKFVDDLAAFL